MAPGHREGSGTLTSPSWTAQSEQVFVPQEYSVTVLQLTPLADGPSIHKCPSTLLGCDEHFSRLGQLHKAVVHLNTLQLNVWGAA